MPSYRYRTALLLGPWRPTAREALDDAVRAGLARRSAAGGDAAEWRFPGCIERADDPPPPPP